MSILVSAITATLNRKDLLERCLESVTSQSYENKEHIIIDGGSSDGTAEFLGAVSARNAHIKWISEPDTGLSNALNKGLKLASGDAIGVIGDDDFYEPDAFAKVVAELELHPEVGLVSGNCRLIRNDGSQAGMIRAAFSNRRDLIECWRNWGNRVSLPAPSTFIRRNVIERVGGFEERDRYAMDYRHWIKITQHYAVRILNEVLANFRYDKGNISFSAEEQQWAETVAISKDYWGSPSSASYYKFLMSYLVHARLRPAINKVRRKLGAT